MAGPARRAAPVPKAGRGLRLLRSGTQSSKTCSKERTQVHWVGVLMLLMHSPVAGEALARLHLALLAMLIQGARAR